MPLSYLRPNPLEERRKITHHHRGLGQTSSAEDKDGDTSITSEPDLSVQPRSFTELRRAPQFLSTISQAVRDSASCQDCASSERS